MAEEYDYEDEFEGEGGEDAACGKGCGLEPMGCATCSKMGRGHEYPDPREYADYYDFR